mgnify:CR=1 FL=1
MVIALRHVVKTTFSKVWNARFLVIMDSIQINQMSAKNAPQGALLVYLSQNV